MPRRANGPATKGTSQRKERKNYMQAVKEVLDGFVIEHADHCYPNQAQKEELCYKTGLTLMQVNNYMINARRRTIPKLLEKQGRSPAKFPRKRKMKNEDSEKSAAAKKTKSCSEQNEGGSGQETSDSTLTPGASSPASTQDENDEVFLPSPPVQSIASSRTDLLSKIVPVAFQPGVASLCIHAEEYQRADGNSSSHSMSSSQSSCSGLSPTRSECEDSTSKLFTRHTTEDYNVAEVMLQLAAGR